MQGVKIFLADQPIASKDRESALMVIELLVKQNQGSGITVVTSLHKIQLVRKYFNRVIVQRTGKVMFNGATVELNDAKLDKIYGAAASELVIKGHSDIT